MAEAWKVCAWAQQLPNGSDADTRTVDLGFEVIAAILRTVLGRWRASNEVNSNNTEVNITERPGPPCVWSSIEASTAGEGRIVVPPQAETRGISIQGKSDGTLRVRRARPSGTACAVSAIGENGYDSRCVIIQAVATPFVC